MQAIDEKRAKWLEDRRSGIGASDAAAILGHSPYKTPLQVWASKMGVQSDGTKFTRAGIMQERVVLEWYEQETGTRLKKFTDDPEVFRNPKEPLILCSPDAHTLHLGQFFGVDAKNTSSKSPDGNAFLNGEIALHYQIQNQHTMMAMGCQRWDLAVLIDGNDFKTFQIYADTELQGLMKDALLKWWRDYVVAKKEPPCATPKDQLEFLKTTYPKNHGRWIDAAGNQALIDMCIEYKHAKENLDAADEFLEHHKGALQSVIRDADGIVLPDGKKISWLKNKDGEKIDWKAVLASLRATFGKQVDEIVKSNTETKTGARTFRTPWDKV